MQERKEGNGRVEKGLGEEWEIKKRKSRDEEERLGTLARKSTTMIVSPGADI